MERRAVNLVLSDELELLKTSDNFIKIKLDDGEILRVFYDNGIYTITHALPTGKRYFSDTSSDRKELIMNIVSSYHVKTISLKNGAEVYSKKNLLRRMKQINSFGLDSESKYLNSLI